MEIQAFGFIKLLFRKHFFFPYPEAIEGKEIQSRKETGKRRDGASGGACSGDCSPLHVSSRSKILSTWPGAVIWSYLLVPRTAANWGQGSQHSSICSATDILKTEGLWTNCQVRSSPGKKRFFAFSRGPSWQQLQPFRPSTPRCPLAAPRQRPHLLKQKRAGKVCRI